MKVYKKNSWMLMLILFLASCQNSVKPSEYVKYVKAYENGLHKNKRVGDFNIDIQYKPTPFVIANEFRKNDISKEEYLKRETEIQDLEYYNIKMSVNQAGQDITKYGISDQEAYQQRLYYLSYKMRDDIQLIEGKDTLSPVLYHFERSYDVTKERTFVVAFEGKNRLSDKTLILDSKPLNTGVIKLRIEEKDLNNLPKISLL